MVIDADCLNLGVSVDLLGENDLRGVLIGVVFGFSLFL